MPVTKFRFVLPVFLGTYKNGTKKLRAYHISGQSEKEAGKSGTRSAEAHGEWRLFNVEPGDDGMRRFKGMWFTDKYFFDNPPKYNTAGDKAFAGKIANYNAKAAETAYYAREPEGEPEVADLRPEPKVPTIVPKAPKVPTTIPKVPKIPMQKAPDVTSPETGYTPPSLEEDGEKNPKIARNNLIRPLFKKHQRKKKK